MSSSSSSSAASSSPCAVESGDTVERMLARLVALHNAENKDVRIVAIRPVAPHPSTPITAGKNEVFVQLDIELRDIYAVGHLTIDFIEDVETKRRYSDKIPETMRKQLFFEVPMAVTMLPGMEQHYSSNATEFTIAPPWGVLGAYNAGCLQQFVPTTRLLLVRCYNNVFYRPKTDEKEELAFFMWRIPRLALSRAGAPAPASTRPK